MEKALELFEEMIHNKVASPDLVACNAIINGLVKEGNLDTACKVLDAMTEQGIPPDSFTFINYINLLCKADRFDDAYQVSSSFCFLLLDVWVSNLGSKVEI